MGHLTTSEIRSVLQAATAAADAARPVTLKWFRNLDLVADNKAERGFDPVTRADRESEQALREVLSRLRPQDAILGEEQADRPGTSGLSWVLDPIDGTRGFMSGTPTWGTLIALSDARGPLLGIIDQPYTDERFLGGLGHAQLHHAGQSRPLAVRRGVSLSEAVLFSTFPEVGTDAERSAFDALKARVRLTRYGMDCYAYALLAAGCIDLVAEAGLFAYDVQAPIAVVQAAGGVVTDWRGRPAHGGGRILAAATQPLHQQALEILSQAPDDA